MCDGAKKIGAYLHIVMPALIVAAALVFHALHNALPLFTLAVLVSAAYGRLAWHDFIQSKRVAESMTEQLSRRDDIVTHRAEWEVGERHDVKRDVALGVEPTR